MSTPLQALALFIFDSSILFIQYYSEYGVLESLSCEKMMLLHADEPDEMHYLHKDGVLYLVGQDPHENENYCIENVINSLNVTEVTYFTKLEIMQDFFMPLNRSVSRHTPSFVTMRSLWAIRSQKNSHIILMDCRSHACSWRQLYSFTYQYQRFLYCIF